MTHSNTPTLHQRTRSIKWIAGVLTVQIVAVLALAYRHKYRHNKIKYTQKQMREITDATNSLFVDAAYNPPPNSITELFKLLCPDYLGHCDQYQLDAWGTPYRYLSIYGQLPLLVSAGPDRKFEFSDLMDYLGPEKQYEVCTKTMNAAQGKNYRDCEFPQYRACYSPDKAGPKQFLQECKKYHECMNVASSRNNELSHRCDAESEKAKNWLTVHPKFGDDIVIYLDREIYGPAEWENRFN